LENLELGNNGVVSIDSTEAEHDDFLVNYTDFLTPMSLYSASANAHKVEFIKLKTSPVRFNSTDLVTEQKFATSKDGTSIPYYIVHKKNLKLDGKNPTLLYGYGGFELSLLPHYLNTAGKVWCEKGGVFVQANIRGGGEFGPAWHEATVKEKHQNAFDDFISVAEDLIKKNITSPAHLGIQGGSNGGLLVGATFIQRPDLFNAVLCQVPLLDMLRYNKLLAGASWMDEYGDPELEHDRKYIAQYSPYQNVKKDMKYPEVFFVTNTKDDRVHPGHARKMVAKMREQGHPLFYFENTEGGHGGAASLEQIIFENALEFTYLWKKLSL
jgi:prolyl oligopeptidase